MKIADHFSSVFQSLFTLFLKSKGGISKAFDFYVSYIADVTVLYIKAIAHGTTYTISDKTYRNKCCYSLAFCLTLWKRHSYFHWQGKVGKKVSLKPKNALINVRNPEEE